MGHWGRALTSLHGGGNRIFCDVYTFLINSEHTFSSFVTFVNIIRCVVLWKVRILSQCIKSVILMLFSCSKVHIYEVRNLSGWH